MTGIHIGHTFIVQIYGNHCIFAIRSVRDFMATITYSPSVHYTAEYRATAAATFYKVTATGGEP